MNAFRTSRPSAQDLGPPPNGAGRYVDPNDIPHDAQDPGRAPPAALTSPSNGGGQRAPRFSPAMVTTDPDRNAHIFGLIGKSGVGKTHFISTIPDMFILSVEEGLKGVSPDHSPAHFPHAPRTLAELYEAIKAFREANKMVDGKRPFKHLALDSLTGIETLIHAEVCGAERVPHMEGKDFQKVWRAAEPVWDRLLKHLAVIRAGGTHLWLVGHASEVFDASSTSGETFRKWDIQIKGAGDIGAAMRTMIRGWADHVLFLDWVTTVKSAKGKRNIAKYEGRVLYTRESGTHYAKTRSALPPSIPATWRDLSNALASGRPVSDGRLRAQIEQLVPKLSSDDQASLLEEMNGASNSKLADILSRAQGMLSVLQEEAAEDEPDVSAPAPFGPNGNG